MAVWDVFHSDRLEVERGLDDAGVRAALARGDLDEDDLIRPGGTATPWARLGDRLDQIPEAAPEPEPEPEPEPPRPKGGTTTADRPAPAGDDEGFPIFDDADFEEVDPEQSVSNLSAFAIVDEPAPPPTADAVAVAEPPTAWSSGPILPPLEATSAIPVPGPAPLPWGEEEAELDFDGDDDYDPLDADDDDDEEGEFTLARGSTETVEELDLAAMVDVAFQLVLFFLVTATTVLYKSLEVPKPNADAPPEAAQQGRTKSIDDLKADFILVEIDRLGSLKIDRQPVPGDLSMPTLAAKLRTLREETGRKSMLLSADFATPHRLAVLAYDAANEIGMGIAIARPTAPSGRDPAPAPPPAVKKG